MPPQPKFTSAEIVEAAIGIVRESGVDALTARELGSRLGTSARPIFTAFKGMDELKAEVKKEVFRRFEASVEDFKNYTPAFKKMGMMMISYAINEPMLYRLLFMQESEENSNFEKVMSSNGTMIDECLEVIQHDYGISEEHARIMLDQLWVYSFGIGALCAMKVCTFTEDEIATMLGRTFMGMMLLIKSDKMDICDMKPFDSAPQIRKDMQMTAF